MRAPGPLRALICVLFKYVFFLNMHSIRICILFEYAFYLNAAPSNLLSIQICILFEYVSLVEYVSFLDMHSVWICEPFECAFHPDMYRGNMYVYFTGFTYAYYRRKRLPRKLSWVSSIQVMRFSACQGRTLRGRSRASSAGGSGEW